MLNISGGVFGKISLEDLTGTVAGEQQQQRTSGDANDQIWAISFSSYGCTLAILRYDKTIELWYTVTGRQRMLGDCTGSVLSVYRSHFNADVFTSGEPLLWLTGEYSSFQGLCVCEVSMGCMLALGYQDGRVALFRLP